MKRNINKKITVLAIILLLSSFLTVMTNTPIGAQLATQQPVSGPLPAGVTVSVTATSASFLSIRPNPVGLGQTFLINVWVNPPPHAYRQYLDYKLSITKPDGTTKDYIMNSYVADGTMWMELVADQLGEWKFKMSFPGIYFPAGRYLDGKIITANTGGAVYEAVYVQGSETKVTTLVVKDEPVQSWPEAKLPTDYWSRPVNAELREWWPIIGNYPWFGPGGGEKWDELYPNTNPYPNGGTQFTPWVLVPESPHIVWKREGALGGIVGGDNSDNSVYWPTTGWQNAPSIILWGRGYQAVTKPSATGPSGTTWWQCYDIRTGELFWERPLYPGESEPNLIEYGLTSIPPVPGVSFKPDTPYLLSIGSGYLRKYDAFSGAMIANVSISPMTGSGGTYFANGHVLGIQDLGSAAGSNRYRLINWTTFGSDAFANRIVSNVTYAQKQHARFCRYRLESRFRRDTTNYMTGGISTHTVVKRLECVHRQIHFGTQPFKEPLFPAEAHASQIKEDCGYHYQRILLWNQLSDRKH